MPSRRQMFVPSCQTDEPSHAGNPRQRSKSKDREGEKPFAAATTTLNESAQKTLDNTGLALTAFSWLLDSGSAFDVVGRSSLSRSAAKRIVTSPHPPQLITANGKLDADKVLPLELKNSGITTNALVLEDSPSV